MAARRIVLDGIEGAEGRALLLVSALHHAASGLLHCQLLMVRAQDRAVRAAVEALRWDTGLDISAVDEPYSSATLQDAALFAAIGSRTVHYLPLQQLAACGVPTLIALQFPSADTIDRQFLPLQRAAHDPRVFAGTMLAKVGRG